MTCTFFHYNYFSIYILISLTRNKSTIEWRQRKLDLPKVAKNQRPTLFLRISHGKKRHSNSLDPSRNFICEDIYLQRQGLVYYYIFQVSFVYLYYIYEIYQLFLSTSWDWYKNRVFILTLHRWIRNVKNTVACETTKRIFFQIWNYRYNESTYSIIWGKYFLKLFIIYFS